MHKSPGLVPQELWVAAIWLLFERSGVGQQNWRWHSQSKEGCSPLLKTLWEVWSFHRCWRMIRASSSLGNTNNCIIIDYKQTVLKKTETPPTQLIHKQKSISFIFGPNSWKGPWDSGVQGSILLLIPNKAAVWTVLWKEHGLRVINSGSALVHPLAIIWEKSLNTSESL